MILMSVCAAKIKMFAVEKKAAVFGPFENTKPERRAEFIDELIFNKYP